LFETLTAEIICVRVVATDRTDTNSLWLTEKLNRLGIEIKTKKLCGDDDARLEEAINRRRSDAQSSESLRAVSVQQEDDIIEDCGARALGRRLLLTKLSLQRFAYGLRTSVGNAGRHSRQAMVIEDAEVFPSEWNCTRYLRASGPRLYCCQVRTRNAADV